MTRGWIAVALGVLVPAAVSAEPVERRLDSCRRVLEQTLSVPESVPRDLLAKAECVAVIPSVKKLAFGFGGRFGRGAVVCRTDHGRGPWGAPLMVELGGGSFGLQIGGQAADVLLLVMNPKGIDKLLSRKLTLGADATVAAGPKGRGAAAATDIGLDAEILSYARTRGLFAGIALEGAVLKQDGDANRALYHHEIEPRAVLFASGAVPAAAHGLVQVLRDVSPNNESGRR